MSKNEIKKLFPTPLYIGNIGVNEDWLTYINSLDFELTYLKNGLQTQDRHILLHKELSSLKKKIDDEFEIYARDKLRINKKHNFEMINSWCNIHNQGHVAQPHHHQNSMFSGVYYLQSTENTGAIKFNQSPFKSWNNIMIKLEIDEKSSNTFKINHKLLFKYFSNFKDPKSAKYIDFESYFINFFHFCFELPVENMIRELEYFKN